MSGNSQGGHDIQTMSIDDVFELLRCSSDGLDDTEASRRQELCGYNTFGYTELAPLQHFLGLMWNPLSWAIEFAALLALMPSRRNSHAPDWEVFVGVLLIMLLNSAIGYTREREEGLLISPSVPALMYSILPKAKVKRDGWWREIESAYLVPGDLIAFRSGDIVPADCRITEVVGLVVEGTASDGEPVLRPMQTGDTCFSGTICQRGEGEAIVVSTGPDTVFGHQALDDDTVRWVQEMIAQIVSFCLVVIGVSAIALCLWAGSNHVRDTILVLLIGGVPLALPNILSTVLASGARDLAAHKAFVSRITAIEELTSATILYTNKTGTLTADRLTIDQDNIRTYGSFSAHDVLVLASYASRIYGQDAVDACVVYTDSVQPVPEIERLEFKPYNPIDKREEVTYRDEAQGKLKRVTKGMVNAVVERCTRNKTTELEARIEADVEEFASRGCRALAVAYEEIHGDNIQGQGNGLEMIGLIPIFDLPREDTKQAVNEAIALVLQVKIVTGDHVAITKETARQFGLGDHIYPAKALRTEPSPGSEFTSPGEMLLHADGFAGVSPKHKYKIVDRLQALGYRCAITGDDVADCAALSRAHVGLAVEGASDAACRAAGIVLLEPGLSTIVAAIRASRIVLQRMRSYAIYTCAGTVRNTLCFSTLAFVFQFDFPPFMAVLIALVGVILNKPLVVDGVSPASAPVSWDTAEIGAYAIAYGIYLSLSTIALVAAATRTTWFYDTFGVTFSGGAVQATDSNDPQLRMIVFLQVAIVGQALIFVTRSHGFSLARRPGGALLARFCIAQLVFLTIAARGIWGFADVVPISSRWIGIVWGWNIAWLLPASAILHSPEEH